MFLSELGIWNFRKYGITGETFEGSEPGVSVHFREGLNVLIGENDSGKTAIVDAIRYTLGTQSGEWIRVEEEDFHASPEGIRAEDLRIECTFRGLTDDDAGHFLEWLGTETVNEEPRFVLTVRFTASRKPNRIVTDLRAGADPTGLPMDGDARALLRVAYLKPLRDADAELTPGRRSRFAQILRAHSLFQKNGTQKHTLEDIVAKANDEILQYFAQDPDTGAGELMAQLRLYIHEFFAQDESHDASVSISGGELGEILNRLSLALDTNPSGLGAANLLFMAAEFLLLQSEEKDGLRLALIEELEAHLHPQAQLRLIRYLESRAQTGQFILTTHSTTIGSSIPLDRLIICKNDRVFPMAAEYTKLIPKNYAFLYRFLDATKANLFFARAVLLVEGDAENLLLPTLARVIGRPLHRYGVSIVNVGSTAFSHYAKIFHRTDGPGMGIKVAVITDMDVKPLEAYAVCSEVDKLAQIESDKTKRRSGLEYLRSDDVQVFVSPNWTLEYEIALSELRRDFYRALLWAQKTENSSQGVPQDSKLDEVLEQVKTGFETWQADWNTDCRRDQKIAYEIYQRAMLDKNISKAVTAQVFAGMLENEELEPNEISLGSRLRNSESLQYLLDAIYYVTEPEDARSAD